MYIDTHCHLSVEDYEDIDVVIKENLEAGVNKIIVSGCEEKTIYEAIELSKKYDCVFIIYARQPMKDYWSDNLPLQDSHLISLRCQSY